MKKEYMVKCLIERMEGFKSLVKEGKISIDYYVRMLPFNDYDYRPLTIQCLMRRTKVQLKEYDLQVAELIYKFQ